MGKVYLVGGGPGDPDLLTIKAYKLLQSADVVLYDALVNKDILNITRPDCLKIYVGKRDSRHTLPQEEINQLLYKFAGVYDKIVRLKGGDPFVFGRGGEELLFLRERGVEVEVVPGITSAVAAPSSALIPITHRELASSFAVITGHPNRGINWADFVKVDTLIILMGVRNRQKIARELIEAGRDPDQPVAFIEKATTTDQREVFTTLKELSQNPPEVNTPAVMVVGDVVGIKKRLETFCKGGLPVTL
ncbi:uroporphyrinogen-III C-methyltransferase [Hydrogenivirga sp. 128-5-R1-1]|uniref:uroporphyrinogen-III C-methyltransferase n=1 Tax=Hydrogenivirga sp. 128-5-R1-1 TaxID=392423 RepID=UPI00015F3847|nr:uroporphyrinogen-III C-methyltransferase [Hydrogenivirga sp. 128-5-R1-1]EDP76476.1 uroporphyrin-III c-methyltransferase [Hydrogenivirga sp. 128-5-R1-1]